MGVLFVFFLYIFLNLKKFKLLIVFQMFLLYCAESLNETCDPAGHDGMPVQIKKDEEVESEEQPVAKRKRGQSKSQAKPKEEMDSGGNTKHFLLYTV